MINATGKAKEELVQEMTVMQERLGYVEKGEALNSHTEEDALRSSEGLLRLILTLSTNFIILSPDETGDGINDVLKAIGSFAKVDRSYVFQFDKTGLLMTKTHEWCAEGIEPQIQSLQNVAVKDFPWFCDKIKNLEVVHVPDASELPLEAIAEKKEFLRQSIQSITAVPIVSGDSIVGFLGFDSVRSQKRWSENIISLLKIVGEIFACALSRKQMMEELRESESKYKTFFEHANESEERYRILTEKSLVGVYLVQDNLFRYVNQAFANIHGYQPEEMVGKMRPMDVIIPEDRPKAEEGVRRRKAGEVDSASVELRIIHTDGTIRNVEVYASRAVYNGRPAELGTLLDVTEKKQLETKLHDMSMEDDLTNLYNRRGFFTVSEQQIRVANRTNNGILAFFIDLDGLKSINDTLGHKEGDDALIRTAKILRETFREADVIGRIGGDEFGVIAVCTNGIKADTLLKRLENHIENHSTCKDMSYKLSLSIGVTHYDPENPQSIEELMSTADTLMYKGKREKHLRHGPDQ